MNVLINTCILNYMYLRQLCATFPPYRVFFKHTSKWMYKYTITSCIILWCLLENDPIYTCRVEMLHAVDVNELYINKHIHQYYLNIDRCKTQSNFFSCWWSTTSSRLNHPDCIGCGMSCVFWFATCNLRSTYCTCTCTHVEVKVSSYWVTVALVLTMMRWTLPCTYHHLDRRAGVAASSLAGKVACSWERIEQRRERKGKRGRITIQTFPFQYFLMLW